MINIHYQKGMVCLSSNEFDRVVKHMVETERELEECNKRILLLEDSLRIAENELKELRYMRESLEK